MQQTELLGRIRDAMIDRTNGLGSMKKQTMNLEQHTFSLDIRQNVALPAKSSTTSTAMYPSETNNLV
jgi:hypothetical protein